MAKGQKTTIANAPSLGFNLKRLSEHAAIVQETGKELVMQVDSYPATFAQTVHIRGDGPMYYLSFYFADILPIFDPQTEDDKIGVPIGVMNPVAKVALHHEAFGEMLETLQRIHKEHESKMGRGGKTNAAK